MNNQFVEEYLIYLNFWLMQRENVQYVANSKNYWYRSESEKSGLWVKKTCGGNYFHLNQFHVHITKSSLILVSGAFGQAGHIEDIWKFPIFPCPPKCASCSKFFKMSNFDYFDKFLKIHTDLRWLMSQKFYFDDGPIFTDLHQVEFSRSDILSWKISKIVDFQSSRFCLWNCQKCFLKVFLFLENTQLLACNN